MRRRARSAVFFLGALAGGVTACSSRDSTPAPQAATPAAGATDSIKAPLSPAEERGRIQREFAGSGPSTEPWTKDAATVFTRSAGEANAASGGVQYSAPECFQAGCLVTATYPDMQRFLQSSQSLAESAVFQDWPGTKYRSPPEVLTDGKVVATWGLFRPIDKQATSGKGE